MVTLFSGCSLFFSEDTIGDKVDDEHDDDYNDIDCSRNVSEFLDCLKDDFDIKSESELIWDAFGSPSSLPGDVFVDGAILIRGANAVSNGERFTREGVLSKKAYNLDGRTFEVMVNYSADSLDWSESWRPEVALVFADAAQLFTFNYSVKSRRFYIDDKGENQGEIKIDEPQAELELDRHTWRFSFSGNRVTWSTKNTTQTSFSRPQGYDLPLAFNLQNVHIRLAGYGRPDTNDERTVVFDDFVVTPTGD